MAEIAATLGSREAPQKALVLRFPEITQAMKSETEPTPQTSTAADSGVGKPTEAAIPDCYANIVKANVTPFDFNLIFGRAAVPFDAPDNQEIRLVDHILPVVRVALPLASLPSIIKLLEQQLGVARTRGLLPRPAEDEQKEGGKP